MNEEQLLATADVESVDSALDGHEENAAILVHADMLNRMTIHFPDVFSEKGDSIFYRNSHPISAHNGEDGSVEVLEAR